MKHRVLFVGRSRYRAAALRDAAPQVGCACGRARRARRRVVASTGRKATPRSACGARTPLDGPLFWLTLPLRVRREARGLEARCDHGAEPVRGGRRARRAHRRAGDRRAARRLADVRASLRLAAPSRGRARRRRGRRLGGASCSGRADASRRTRRGWRARPDARWRPSFPRTWTSSPFAGAGAAVARADDSALHRRPGALQEHRRSRRRLAAREAAAARRRPPARRLGNTDRHPRVARARRARDVGAATRHERNRRCARRVERARPSLALRGHGTRRDRGAVARPPRARQRRRRHPGPGHRRRRRRARRARPRRDRRRHSCGCSRIRRRSRGSRPPRVPPASAGS